MKINKNMTPVCILGTGGMAKEVYYIYKCLGQDYRIQSFVIEGENNPHSSMLGKPIVSSMAMPTPDSNIQLIAAIGSPLKNAWVERLESQRYMFDILIHPNVVANESINIHMGSIICSNVSLPYNVALGKHCIVNTNVSIHHDTQIGPYCHIAPGVQIAGNVTIGKGSWIGIGAVVMQKITIGEGSFIGAGSVVVENIPDHVLVTGTPARIIRKIEAEDWKQLLA